MQGRKEWPLILSILLLDATACQQKPSAEQVRHNRIQTRSVEYLERAVGRFPTMQQTDTIDFASLAPFEWDTVYVFGGGTSVVELTRDLSRINWELVVDGLRDPVPEEMTRFTFVKGQKAVDYIDIDQRIALSVHFSTYYRDAAGTYRPAFSYINSDGKVIGYTINHFSRKQAKFILVRPTLIVGFPTLFYGTLPYFSASKTVLPDTLRSDYIMYLHPVIGCGLKSCLGNDSTRKRIGLPGKPLLQLIP